MALKLKKVTEASFTKQVVNCAKLFGWQVVHFDAGRGRSGKWITPFIGDKGFPDVIAVRGGVLLAAELKVGKNPTTPEQEIWLARFAAVPGTIVRVWRETDWADIETVLRGD